VLRLRPIDSERLVHLQIRDQILRGHDPPGDQVREMIRPQAGGESLTFEFKEAPFLDGKPKGSKDGNVGHPFEAGAVLRKWVAGFANAVGGLLVVGVTDDRSTVPGLACPSKKHGWANWLANALRGFAGQISPPPNFSVVTIGAVEVLLVAVPQSDSLVACVEQGQLVHYFRIGESTVAAPPYLVADLISGRRRRPRFRLSDLNIDPERSNGSERRVRVNWAVENDSLAWASKVDTGLVYASNRGVEPPSELLARIEFDPRNSAISGISPRLVWTRLADALAPFGSARFSADFAVPPAGSDLLLEIGCYVACPEAPPCWFTMRFERGVVTHAPKDYPTVRIAWFG